MRNLHSTSFFIFLLQCSFSPSSSFHFIDFIDENENSCWVNEIIEHAFITWIVLDVLNERRYNLHLNSHIFSYFLSEWREMLLNMIIHMKSHEKRLTFSTFYIIYRCCHLIMSSFLLFFMKKKRYSHFLIAFHQFSYILEADKGLLFYFKEQNWYCKKKNI